MKSHITPPPSSGAAGVSSLPQPPKTANLRRAEEKRRGKRRKKKRTRFFPLSSASFFLSDLGKLEIFRSAQKRGERKKEGGEKGKGTGVKRSRTLPD